MAENYYRENNRVIAQVTGLGSSSDFDLTPADWGVSNVDIHTYIVGDACDIKLLVDPNSDFSSPDTNITLDSFGGSGISEGNHTPITISKSAIRITNTGSSADFVAVGDVYRDGDD